MMKNQPTVDGEKPRAEVIMYTDVCITSAQIRSDRGARALHSSSGSR